MKTQEIIDFFGGKKQAAQALNIWPQTLYNWGEYPPQAKQYEAQVKSNGKLKAEPEKINLEEK